jgi:hypothetical protein
LEQVGVLVFWIAVFAVVGPLAGAWPRSADHAGHQRPHHPVWTLAWQTRAAARMLRHRPTLERAMQG